MNQIQEINEKSFSMSLKKRDDRVEIIISGKIDTPDSNIFITPFLEKIDKEMVNNNISDIYFDVCKLHFINSSGIKVILQHVMNIIKRPVEQQYNIIFEYDETLEIQKTRFKSLLFIAPNIIKFLPVKS